MNFNRKRRNANDDSDDRIIREIPLIQRYSRHNEDDDFRFRTFLKTRLNLSIAKTDAIVRSTTEEVCSQIDCRQCAHCCRTLEVVVDAADVKRLAARLKITPADFSRRYVQTAEDRTMIFAGRPCPFLGDDNLCTVYDDRPKACRDFPYLHERHFVSRSMMMIDNTAVCPIVFNVWRALKTRLGFRRGGR